MSGLKTVILDDVAEKGRTDGAGRVSEKVAFELRLGK